MCNFSKGVWEKGQFDGVLSSIKNLMKNTDWPIEQVMSMLGVPDTDRSRYLELLANSH